MIESNTMSPMDSPERVKLINSRWQSLLHFRERKNLDQKVSESVKQYFQESFHMDNRRDFDRLWKELGEPVWTPEKELTQEKVDLIKKNFENIVFYGKGIFFEDDVLCASEEDKAIHEIIQAICHGEPFPNTFFSTKFLYTVFVKADPKILHKLFVGLQENLQYAADHPPKDAKEEALWEAFRGNLLALLPYSYPPSGSQITVPIKINGIYQPVDYKIKKIPLSITSMASPMNALELIPKNATEQGMSEAPPILSYMGTTFPGAEGFFTTLLADSYPGKNVGQKIYEDNKGLIEDWFKDKKNVIITGTSLGGILSLQTARDFSEKISSVFSYQPPGFDWGEWTSNINENCKVKIFIQAGDIVSKVGLLPKGKNISVYHVIPLQEGIDENFFTAHVKALTGCKRVTIIEEDVDLANKKYKSVLLTFFHKYIGPWVVFIPTYGSLLIYKGLKKIVSLSRKVFTFPSK